MPEWIDLLDSINQKFDNVISGLTATNVKEALDELANEKVDDTNSVFQSTTSYAGSPTQAIQVGSTTNVDFSSGNLLRFTGTGGTTIGTITTPGVGAYTLLIPDTVTIIGVDPTVKKEFGGANYTFPAGVEHIMTIVDFGDGTFRWSAIGEL